MQQFETWPRLVYSPAHVLWSVLYGVRSTTVSRAVELRQCSAGRVNCERSYGGGEVIQIGRVVLIARIGAIRCPWRTVSTIGQGRRNNLDGGGALFTRPVVGRSSGAAPVPRHRSINKIPRIRIRYLSKSAEDLRITIMVSLRLTLIGGCAAAQLQHTSS